MPFKWLCRFAQLAVALLGAQLAACTTVEIHTLDGAVKIERHVGVLGVELKPNAREQVVSSQRKAGASGRRLPAGSLDREARRGRSTARASG
jgi:hypothetical protein